MVSIITVINNEEIYINALYKSLKNQCGIEYELIELFNQSNKTYSSLHEAYHAGVSKSKGELLIFVHQDVIFTAQDSLLNLVNKAKQVLINRDVKICGVAGVEYGSMKYPITNIRIGKDCRTSRHGIDENVIWKYVQTIDACLFVLERKIINFFGFSEYLSGYHLLVEDLCIRIGEHNWGCAVINENTIWHLSEGDSLNYMYYRNARKIIKRYPNLGYLNTTCFQWKVTGILPYRLLFYEVRNFIHHYFKRYERGKNVFSK